ncbi:SDR family oxidoreductase [Dyadobacter sp. CY326]|uniref:SDR family NAD(P)-dependent oxidoreductase n=1 Tax=Dyadobacter sp. CY326 TaxID=2907300 RepID=UPI001F3E46F7|nr:SDR family NAD(P)-dependent oxidoreductase [Dyadobacter sp. CY326]MCE7066404.1 SDR family NAD(P)-dependent oxidoreductase [Dyadobacter sp. CY326]
MNNNSNQSLFSGKLALWAAAGLGAYAAAKHFYREMIKFDFQDKVVVITGGARGLGLLLARELAAKGANLVICSRNAEQLFVAEQELRRMGSTVLGLKADVSDPRDANRVIEAAISQFGQVDVLINNAGVMLVGPENVMDVEDYKTAMDSNFWAALYMIKAVLPHFHERGEGRIANVCSIGGKVAVPHLLPYSVSKFAMVALSEGLHAELKKDNIHITTVIPNLMRTGSPRNVSLKGDHEAEYAWFKLADSSPLLSQNASDAAAQIVNAIVYREAEVILTKTAKLAVAVQGISPALVSLVMSTANRFLPKSGPEGAIIRKGYESESKKTAGPVASKSDRAALENNEL